MAAKPLTSAQVDAIRRDGTWRVDRNLYLQQRGGSRTWLFRFQLDRQHRWMGLGPTDLVSLADAKKEVLRLRLMLLNRQDPFASREADRAAATSARPSAAPTFSECVEAFLASHAPSWRSDKTRVGWERSLLGYAESMVDVPVDRITVDHVLQVLQPIWLSRAVSARATRQRIERVVAWAVASGYRPAGDNPASMNTIRYLLPTANQNEVRHHAAVAVKQMPSLWSDLEKLDSISSLALRFTILTAARTGETIGATWDEIDLVERLWSVPAERSKTGRPHRVPLSSVALELLEALPGDRRGMTFPGQRGRRLSSMAQLMCLRGLRPGTTVHGTARSSFRDWAAETGVQREVAEACLAHVVGGVEGAYLRSDLLEQRRPVMQAWADYLASVKHS